MKVEPALNYAHINVYMVISKKYLNILLHIIQRSIIPLSRYLRWLRCLKHNLKYLITRSSVEESYPLKWSNFVQVITDEH